MKKITLALVCLFLFLSCSSAALSDDVKEIVVYTESQYRPFSYVENGKLKGIYVDLIRQIDDQLQDYSIELFAMPWEKALDEIDQGNGDALLGTYFMVDTRPNVYPLSIPIYQEEVILVCSEITMPSPNNNFPQDFKGKVIANVEGYEAWERDAAKDVKFSSFFRFFEVPSTDIALSMVVKDRIDCALFERLAYESSLAYISRTGKYKSAVDQRPVIAEVISAENAYLGFRESAYNSRRNSHLKIFKKQFDIALKDFQSTGKLEQIIAQYSTSNLE